MLRTTFAGLRAHKLRLLLTATAIMIGVGFLAGTLVYGDTAKAAFYDDLARAARNVDVSVQPRSAPSFVETSRRVSFDAVDELRAVPGVSQVDGRLAERLPMLDSRGRLISNFGRIGWVVSTPGIPSLSMYDMKSGSVPVSDGEIAVDQTTVDIYGFTVGGPVSVVGLDQKPVTLTLVGVLDLGANKRFSGLTVAALSGGDLRRLTGAQGFAEVVASAAPGVSQRTLASRVDSTLNGRYRVVTGADLREDYAVAAAKYVDGFLVVIFGFGLIALAVSVFVIYNTFAILVAQRTRELALLRCVGASRRQLFGSVVVESVVVGVLASLGGLLVSTVVGYGLLLGRDAVGSGVPVHFLVIKPATVVIGVVAGTLFTVVAALLPALTASRVPPMAALRVSADVPVVPGGRRLVRPASAAGLAGAGVFVMLIGTGRPGFDGIPIVFSGAILVFAGIVVAAPLIVARLTAWVGWLPARFLGAPGRLGIANALRNPKRVAATTSALMVGLALMSVFSVLLATARAQAEQELDENFSVDYVISGVYTEHGNSRVPLAVADALRQRAELAAVAAARSDDANVGGRRAEIWSLEPGALDTVLRPEFTAGSPASLGAGKVALNRFFADAIGVRLGSTVLIDRSFPAVVGALYDDAPTDGDALLDWSDYATIVGPGEPDRVLVKAAEGVSPDASRAAVDEALRLAPLTQVSSQAEWRARITGSLDEQLGVFSALLGMSIVIGLTGIANTLSLSVLERTRESALLRALGLSRGQLRGTLVFEALLMAVVGAVIGVGFGVLVGAASAVGLIRQYGHGAPTIPVGQLLLYVAVAALAGAVAAVLPARRAARTDIVAAMIDD